jgi:plastocyanin
MKMNQKGFGVLELLLLLILVSIVGFGGYYVWNTNDDGSSESAKTSSQAKEDSESDTDTGGPAPGHIVSNTIKVVTGQYTPATIDIKKSTAVTWQVTDSGSIPNYAVVSDTSSSEKFESDNLKTGDKFTYTFNKVGTFGWHDKYNGNLKGSITVTE